MNVLQAEFQISDHWMRYEFQGRGTIHAHMLIWAKDRPNFERLMEIVSDDLLEKDLKIKTFECDGLKYVDKSELSEEALDIMKVIQDWSDRYISCWNHYYEKMGEPYSLVYENPARYRLENIAEEFIENEGKLMTRVNRHVRCSHYCLRYNKELKKLECRFHFPYPCRDETFVGI